MYGEDSRVAEKFEQILQLPYSPAIVLLTCNCPTHLQLFDTRAWRLRTMLVSLSDRSLTTNFLSRQRGQLVWGELCRKNY